MSISINMAVSACVPGPVFGDTVYGRMGEAAFLCAGFLRKIEEFSAPPPKGGLVRSEIEAPGISG